MKVSILLRSITPLFVLLAVGCGDGAVDVPGTITADDTDDPVETDTDLETDDPEAPKPQLDDCDAERTCNRLEDPADCVANFELGTTQAGFKDEYDVIGFYAYNDHSEGSSMVPVPNPNDSEPAETLESCDSEIDSVIHVKGSGFVDWGAGVGMDWGGPLNPACDADGALDCLQIGIDDANFSLAEAADDPACDTEEKLTCLTKGKNIKETKDLSEYRGIGFWVLRNDEASASVIKVAFPIPDTVRFYGECSEDDGEPSTNCFNDFAATIRLLSDELGKWVWKEVLFKDLKINEFWGLQLDLDAFPADESIGIKFQVDADQGDFDFYLDDLILLR